MPKKVGTSRQKTITHTLKFLQQIYVLEVSFPKHTSVKDSKAILGQSISIFVRHAEQLICRCNWGGGGGRVEPETSHVQRMLLILINKLCSIKTQF